MAYTRFSAAQAVTRAKGWTSWKVGYCLNFVWNCLDYPNTAGLGSANAAWSAAKQKVYSGTPPAGAPVYWAGGSYGHIAISVGGGYVRSTDWPVKGKISTVSISRITSAWGLKYRGWSKDYAGKVIAGLGGTASNSTTNTAYPLPLSVDKTSVIYAHNLRPGARNTDVARFEKALYNYLGGAYRKSIAGDRAAVGDGYYGSLTSKMCSDAYAKAGMSRANYPSGTGLLKVIGFTNAKV